MRSPEFSIQAARRRTRLKPERLSRVAPLQKEFISESCGNSVKSSSWEEAGVLSRLVPLSMTLVLDQDLRSYTSSSH